MRVALFSTCIADSLFPDSLKATMILLTRLGLDVVVPKDQSCCGQMHVNTGYQEEALPLVKNYVDVFSDPSIEYVVCPSGSCTAAVREQHSMVSQRYGDAHLEHAVELTAHKTYELSEFLVDVLHITDVGAFFPHRVTYHTSCHSRRMLNLGDKPFSLLRSVEGIDLVDLPLAEECCGFGGTFSVKNSETSASMANEKVRHIRETEAEYVTAGDVSCLMNIAGVMARQKAGVRALHFAEILASTKEQPWSPEHAAYAREAML